MNVWGFQAIEAETGKDVTFSFVFQHHWNLRHEPQHREFLRTMIRIERINREMRATVFHFGDK